MSLNGLDTPDVQDAHQSAIADPGGWFLLRYTSRDAVELHGRGRGGVAEARAAIANYKDNSPLYGLLIYRRRKVLIKYIPAETSRVLQARTAVHFQDVVERYAPYDTLLEITTAEGLKETSLAASFPLHTASLSTHSNSSKLQEISEDAEDSGSAPRKAAAQRQGGGGGGLFSSRKKDRATARTPPIIRVSAEAPGTTAPLPPGKTSISSQILVREDSGKRSITTLGSSPLSSSVISYDTAPSEISATTRTENDSNSSIASDVKAPPPRTSTSILRPGTQGSSTTVSGVEPLLEESSLAVSPPTSSGSDTLSHSDRMKKVLEEPFDFSYLEPKKKIRLAPRPVAATAKRATTGGVSALPSHYRPQTKKQEALPAPTVNSIPILPIPPIPASQEYDPRPVSRGSVKSLPSTKNATMTPDKIRLMKAVELRKRQLRRSNPALPSTIPGLEANTPEVPPIPDAIRDQSKSEVKGLRVDEVKNAAVGDEAVAKKADSGIEMEYQKNEKQSDGDTTTDATAARASLDKQSLKIPSVVEEPVGAESAPAAMPTMPTEVFDINKSSSTTTEAHKAADTSVAEESITEPVGEETQDPAVAEALRNDELRAEAEGYGAVPAPISEDHQPSLHKYDNESSQDAHTGDAISAPELVVEEAQDDLTDSEVLKTPTLPSSSLTETYKPSGMPPASSKQANDRSAAVSAGADDDGEGREFVENDDEAEDHDDIEAPTSPRQQNSVLAKRRRGIVEPLHMETQNELLSDEELMDELQDATVQEAKPMPVSKSPVMSRRPSDISLVSAQSQHSDRSASAHTINANRERAAGELESHTDGIQIRRRSVSPMERKDTLAGLRRNVGTGIAKRFAALTEGNREAAVATANNVQQAQSLDTSPGSKRKGNHRSRTGSFKNRWGIGGDRATSSSTVASTNEMAPTWRVSQDSNNRDSISVRARIVRPPSALDTHAENPETEVSAPSMQASKIEVNHSVGTSLPPLQTASAALSSLEGRTIQSSASRRRNESIHALATQPEDLPLPLSATTASSITGDDSSTMTSSVGSRTSRFFKRMSIMGTSNKRKSMALQSVPIPDSAAGSVNSTRRQSTVTIKDNSDMPPAAALGDLNVQFPDTLLWKRRWLTLDDSGNLILGIPQSLEHSRGLLPKKHHLSEFKAPYIPDLDRQEIPHSICLDFNEGGTLQVACEDAMGQRQVLSMLRNYHKSWTAN